MKKIALVGFGFIGQTHSFNILNNRHLQLIAVVDRSIGNIENDLKKKAGNFSTGSLSMESLHGVKLYATMDECLSAESVDAYFICVHTDQHIELAEKALLAGMHVFLEKPFCLEPSQGEALISLARKKGLLLMVGHVVRFMPAYQKLSRWISSGEFGPLRFLSLSRFSGIPLWGEWKQKQQAFGSSGGALFDLVIHDVDFAQSILGRPDSITARVLPGKLSGHDFISTFWSYHNTGATIKIEGGNIFHSTFPFQAGFSAAFERASIFYTSLKPDFITVSVDDYVTQLPAGDANDGFKAEVEYFASCMESNLAPLECMPESSLLTIEICHDIINSI